MTWQKSCVSAAGLALCLAFNLMAGPIVQGDVSIVSAPPSLLQGAFESNDTAFLFLEAERLVVNSAMSSLWGLREGTRVNLWMIHADATKTVAHNTGSILFDKPILRVDTDGAALSLGDVLTGSTLIYPTRARGLESHDSFQQVSPNQVSFNFRTYNQVDQVRIAVADSPEPATLGLAGVGILVVVLASRRRARRNETR